MVLRIYTGLWVALAILVVATLLTGYLSELAIVIYGFVAFALIFMGMIGVLPFTLAHPSHEIKADRPERKQFREKDFGHTRQVSIR